MNIVILNAEQLAAAAIAGLIISGGQNGNAVNIVKRANSALAFATAATQLGQGNPQPAFAGLSTALQDSSLDPGVIVAFQGLLNFGLQQVTLLDGVKSAVPVFGDVAEAVAINVGAGITAAANAEIAKYGPPAAAATAAAQAAAAAPQAAPAAAKAA